MSMKVKLLYSEQVRIKFDHHKSFKLRTEDSSLC
jgi:hypothetical protein